MFKTLSVTNHEQTLFRRSWNILLEMVPMMISCTHFTITTLSVLMTSNWKPQSWGSFQRASAHRKFINQNDPVLPEIIIVCNWMREQAEINSVLIPPEIQPCYSQLGPRVPQGSLLITVRTRATPGYFIWQGVSKFEWNQNQDVP